MGKTSHELVPDVISKELADSLVAHDRAVLESGQASEVEDEVTLEDGVHTILTVKFPIPDAEGGIAGIGAISTDISERRRIEDELRRKDRLATIGQLTATVSHELRNPLGTIRTSMAVIEAKSRDKGLGVERALDRVDRNIVRCDEIIEDLLDYTRVRELDLAPTPVDDWLAGLFDELAVPEGLTVRRELGAAGVSVALDRNRLRRAIVNVYDNACQAMEGALAAEDGGEDRILEVRTSAGEGRLELAIRDTGPGIPAEAQAKIFEPLYSTKTFGVGLGLPTVKQIVEQHGGGVEVTSEEGRGTRVLIWLPLPPEEQGRTV